MPATKLTSLGPLCVRVFARTTGIALALLALSVTTSAQDSTVQLLQLLSDAPGAPGFEEPIRKIMVDNPLATYARLRDA